MGEKRMTSSSFLRSIQGSSAFAERNGSMTSDGLK